MAISIATTHGQSLQPLLTTFRTIASTVEPVQDGRIYIELINGPFLFNDKGSPAEYGAGMKLALERGWLVMHESGSYVKFSEAGAELFA